MNNVVKVEMMAEWPILNSSIEKSYLTIEKYRHFFFALNYKLSFEMYLSDIQRRFDKLNDESLDNRKMLEEIFK